MLRKARLHMVLLAVLSALPLAAGSATAQEPVQPWQQPQISIAWPHDGYDNPASVGGSARSTLAVPAIDAKIEVVWPHDRQGQGAPVATAPLVNVEVYLFERGTLNPVPCDLPNRVILRWSRSEHAGRPGATLYPAHDLPGYPGPGSALGACIMRTVDGKTFPVWLFNDVPTLMGEGNLSLVDTYFFVEVEGADARSNVWAHAVDPRTILPSGYPPTGGVSDSAPSVIDALITVVYPHSFQGAFLPAAEAPLVNVGVDLAEHPAAAGGAGWRSAAAHFEQPVQLLRSLNDGYLEVIKPADQVVTQTVEAFGVTYSWPRWEFDDVDVSAVQNPMNKYYFAVRVDGVPTHTTIWSHGADPRTFFPQRDVPACSCDV